MGRRILLLSLFLILSLLYGCTADDLSADYTSGPVRQNEYTEELYRTASMFSGKKVGVMSGWESDYILTQAAEVSHITVYRYDNVADMIMALKHRKIDAVFLDDMCADTVLTMTQGIEKFGPSIGDYGYMSVFASDNEALRDDYNEFLKYYITTPEYAKVQKSIDEYDGISMELPYVEPTGTGEILRVAYNVNGYPSAWLDTETNTIQGHDIIPLVMWANDRNYKIEFSGGDYTSILMGVSRKKYDVCVGFMCELYIEEFIIFDLYPSDPVYHSTACLMVMNGDGLSADDAFYDEYQ